MSKNSTPPTAAANRAVREYLPFDDDADFAQAERGLIGTEDHLTVTDGGGGPVWDLDQWAFLTGDAPDTVNPSLWRQARLNAIHGLFRVTEGVYQVRGYDLSVMSVIEGDTGYLVVDPLISAETAAAAMALVRKHLGDRPVVAVIHTHSHVDHYGGVRGVVDKADVDAGRVRIVAPHGFFEHAISENVMAGTAMSRRSSYMYGNLLPKDPTGAVGGGLGKGTSAGSIGLLTPTDVIRETGETLTIDGVEIVFQDTPGAEAPAEFCFYLPRYKALCMAEIATHTLHNCYTLRGAEVRNALLWSKYLGQAVELFCDEAEVVFASHHWPTWGNAEVREYLITQRDLYRYIHDETLRLANHGYTSEEIAELVRLPDSLAKQFANRGYYGTLSHNVKAQYQLYLGWFDGNPANLEPLPPVETATRRVAYMGGADAVFERARADFERGEYRWVAQVVNDVVFADPDNAAARELQADTLEQLGYQAESGPWRNFYLSAAQELRHGVRQLPTPVTASADTIRGMSLEMYLDYLAIRLNGPAAANEMLRFDATFTDLDTTYALVVANGVLNYTEGGHTAGAGDPAADATLTLTRAALDDVTLGVATFDEQVEKGEITIDGDGAAFTRFLGLLDTFEFWFDIVTP
ncbi:alkyl/aryl-sulfatase [Pseudonocardia kunmingensis]|uniref:Linear primary-alkylsulfatase n=1 Tax=Pseudonocardia kunmingensis TaxID=630975 RepID=A0A543DWA5_9PSEU|nr:alkyl sulfatase dimerization domain-containing protein [Pseudonocardia kunmingensis]TQM13620.1 alkyl sulfatase BDS1-like metallo-beta-lactamase superfamily hydrolase [Pseudonocardia kunmingensis]